MSFNPSIFHKINVADTCAVWNILSSAMLLCRASAAKCDFCITSFVLYECLHKPRNRPSSPEENRLVESLKRELHAKRFRTYQLEIEDLQDVAVLERRRNLGKGELSSMIFARKVNQAFMTDDQRARKLAATILDDNKIQTVVWLLGWLIYSGYLTDGEAKQVIEEHEQNGRPLKPYMEIIYRTALERRLMDAGQNR